MHRAFQHLPSMLVDMQSQVPPLECTIVRQKAGMVVTPPVGCVHAVVNVKVSDKLALLQRAAR